MISFDDLFRIDPDVEYFPEYDCKGEYNGICFHRIKAITYNGAMYKGKPTRIFAHIGFPENTQKPVPAVVLVHGGGGHPDDVWIKKWNEHGYAAIAMSTDGFFPCQPMPLCEGHGSECMVHKLVHPFHKEGYIETPGTTHIADSDIPIKDQWMYHAVASVILANNLLHRDERVTSDRIGICGISWGGIIAAITIGYDPRFAFAIPIYGSGYLGCGHSGLDKIFNVPGTQKWYAEKRFDRVKIPVMWLCWNDDCCFSVNSNSMSYQDTKQGNSNTCLSMIHNMGHSHSCAYTPKESYWFADEVLAGNRIPEVTAEYAGNTVKYSCSVKTKSIRLFYITEKMTYTNREKHGLRNTFMEQDWQIVDLDPDKNQATLPDNAVGKYTEFTLENGIVLTTPYNEFKNQTQCRQE
ncbi:MAG: dienelactone hydrolase family protein [Clostridia bacterium]|nr:dienelactone hydrolase family protein [Clostridia bacterium]